MKYGQALSYPGNQSNVRFGDDPQTINLPPSQRREAIQLKCSRGALNEAGPMAFWATQDYPLCHSFSPYRCGRQADHQ
jgi:hypothetical protein